MRRWFDPHTRSGWFVSRFVRKPLLWITLLLCEGYMKQHGPDWRLCTEEHKRQQTWEWRRQYPDLPDLEILTRLD